MQPGKNNSSQQGKKRRKKEAKERWREQTRRKPYERTHDPEFYRRHLPVFIVSLETLDIVYETTAYGYTHKAPHVKIKGRCWTDEDIKRASYVEYEWDGR